MSKKKVPSALFEASRREAEARLGRRTRFDENPEWTEEDFSRAKRASEVHGPEIAAGLIRRRGRPPKAEGDRKEAVSIRLSREVLDFFRASGAGWQTRIDEVLRTVIEDTKEWEALERKSRVATTKAIRREEDFARSAGGTLFERMSKLTHSAAGNRAMTRSLTFKGPKEPGKKRA